MMNDTVKEKVEMLKKISKEGLTIPLDLKDIKAVIEYIQLLESALEDSNSALDRIIKEIHRFD
jgi:cytochrome c